MERPANGLMSYQKYTFYALFTLKFPFITDDSPWILHMAWECISWMSVFLPLHLSVCHFIELYQKFETESIDVVSNIGIQGAWLVCSFITMLNYKLMSKHLDDMINEIDATFQWRSAKGKTYVTLEKCYRYARFISILWQITPVSSVVANLIRPLFRRPLVMPSSSWYPLNLNNPFNFALAYLFQSWAQLIVVCSFAAGSTLFCSFSLLCCGQFNILRCAFKNLVFTSGVYKRFPDTLELTNIPADSADYLFAVEMDDTLLPITQPDRTDAPRQRQQPKGGLALTPEEIINVRKVLIDCIKHHRQLKRICALMETFLNFFAFLRVFELTAQMCFMAFVYTKTSDTIILLFGVFAGFDLFLLTYPAEHILYQNNSVGASLLLGPWYLVAKYFRHEFIIIMAYTHRPIRFTAGKIILLNADRLRLALTAAFSYYTLLSSFDE